jgi:SRSO17 transposase
MADCQARKWSAWHHHTALVMMAMLFLLRERRRHEGALPLLSCADVEELLAEFLPRRPADPSPRRSSPGCGRVTASAGGR